MVAVLTLVGVAAMLVAWHGDGQEVTRHTVEGFAQVRLGVWILLTLGLLGSADPGPERPAGGPSVPAGDGTVGAGLSGHHRPRGGRPLRDGAAAGPVTTRGPGRDGAW